METNAFRNWCVQNRATMKEIICRKCNMKLLYIEPSHSMSQCGTDYWTWRGERIWKPTVCAICKSKNGRHAQAEQNKQIVESETRKHTKHMENVLNSFFQ